MAVLEEARRHSNVPVIVISARHEEQLRVRLLDAGADDYLVKPFGIPELLARIRVALRHRGQHVMPATTRYRCGAVHIDLPARLVTRASQEVRLTPTEWKLLARLVRSAGRVVTHRQLLGDVWGADHVEHTHYLRLYMSQLRAKLEQEPAAPVLLLSEPGVGYLLAEGE
jgi:two-component system KDP operon response regulator KdpE